MSHHLSSIKDSFSNSSSSCKKLAAHFNGGLCKGSKFTIRILEKLEGNGRVGSKRRDPIDGTSKRLRLAREKHWMLKLRTVFPFGLNEKVGDDWKQNDSTPVSSKFPKLHRSLRVSRGIKLKNKKHQSFFNTLDDLLKHNLKEAMNYIRVFLFSASKKVIKSIYCELAEKIITSSELHHQWYKAATDIITSCIIYKEPAVVTKRESTPLTWLN